MVPSPAGDAALHVASVASVVERYCASPATQQLKRYSVLPSRDASNSGTLPVLPSNVSLPNGAYSAPQVAPLSALTRKRSWNWFAPLTYAAIVLPLKAASCG